VEVPNADPRLDAVELLALEGKMHDALAALEQLGPPERLSGARARCMAAWLYGHLGATRTSLRWHAAVHARSRNQPSALFFHGFSVLRYRGPLEAWLLLRDYRRPEDCTEVEHVTASGARSRPGCCTI
jgi:hypothetical protein